jgi:uncharacterized RDD family membrane protein YckC
MTTGDPDPNSPQYGYPPPSAHGQHPGGLGVRFLARLIDGIIVNIAAFVRSLSPTW